MSRIESGKVKIEEKAVHLPDLVHDVRSIIQPNVAAKRLSLFIDTMDIEDEDIITDPLRLNQILLNILSNAIKFTPKGGTVTAKLTRSGRMLRLSVTDSGSGIAQSVRSSVFSRYLRQPALEDSRYGIGLGMVLIRTAAAHHGGAVLIDQPEGAGTRITMTMSIRQSKQATLRSNVLRVDYAGERDHGLIELSECLPTELYE